MYSCERGEDEESSSSRFVPVRWALINKGDEVKLLSNECYVGYNNLFRGEQKMNDEVYV
jgi:hypothetical protein